MVDDKLPEERGMVGQGEKEIAEQSAFEMARERLGPGLFPYTFDEVRQLRLRAPRIRNQRGFRQAVEKGIRLVRHGQSIGYLRAP
jgi:hypothetical protein